MNNTKDSNYDNQLNLSSSSLTNLLNSANVSNVNNHNSSNPTINIVNYNNNNDKPTNSEEAVSFLPKNVDNSESTASEPSKTEETKRKNFFTKSNIMISFDAGEENGQDEKDKE